MLMLVTGCTTQLTALPEPASATGPSHGIPYRLPEKQFVVTASWQLTDCLTSSEMNAQGVSTGNAGLKFKAKVDYKPELIEGQSILLDYRKLTNRFKEGELTVDYWQDASGRQTRFIKSINSTIIGKEPEALKSGIKAVTNIGKTILTLSGPQLAGALGPGAPADKRKTCTDTTLGMIEQVAEADGELKKMATRAEEIAARFALLKSRALFDRLTPKDQKEYAALTEELDKLEDRRTKIDKSVQQLRSYLTYTEEFTYIPRMATAEPDSLLANEEKAVAWLRKLLDPANVPDAKLPDEAANLRILATVRPLGGDAGRTVVEPVSCGTAPAGQALSCPGYVYREPVAARLRFDALELGERPVELANKIETIPQVGRLRILGLRSRFGEKNQLTVDQTIDGAPTKISHKALEAGGPKLAYAFEEASAAALELATLRAKQDEAEDKLEKEAAEAAEKEELDALKQEIELAKARDELAGLQAQPSESEAAQAARLATLRAQKEEAELEAAIREANRR
jgi:predicted  nucleic acid-binding Zn-ribbon protein